MDFIKLMDSNEYNFLRTNPRRYFFQNEQRNTILFEWANSPLVYKTIPDMKN